MVAGVGVDIRRSDVDTLAVRVNVVYAYAAQFLLNSKKLNLTFRAALFALTHTQRSD